jgi:hypothetical protein
MLDINQTGSGEGPLLSLDRIMVYQGSTGGLTTQNPAELGILRYSLDNGGNGNNWIKLNYDLNTGSGSGDMFAYIPDSVFTGSNQYVYLYSKFGENFVNNDGYEEWAVTTATAIPEPATMLLLGSGLIGLAGFARRRFKK